MREIELSYGEKILIGTPDVAYTLSCIESLDGDVAGLEISMIEGYGKLTPSQLPTTPRDVSIYREEN